MSAYDPDALDRRDPRLIAWLLPLAETVSRRYFRFRSDGHEHVPAGPALFVANHNGGIMGPDLFCTLPLLWRLSRLPLYAMAHDFAMRQLTPLGRLLQRLGAIRACRGNAERVLAGGGAVLVYPGGDLDAYRHFRRRDEVVILPRTGFVEVARRTGVPIVPVVAAGAHRCAVIFSEGRGLARLLRLRRWGRLERFPLALALPWGFAPGPWLPYLPLPWPIRVRILPPVHVARDADIDEVARSVEAGMQAALDELDVRASVLRLPGRGHVVFRRQGKPREVPLLLLRPLGGSLLLWDELLETLDAEVIVFDPRGVGESSPAPLLCSTRCMAHDALAVLDALAVHRADVFGLSLGGLVASWLVHDAPGRVRRLALGSTPTGKLLSPRQLAVLLAQIARREPEVALVHHVISPEFRAARPEQVRAIEARVRLHPARRRTLARFALAAALHDAPEPGEALWMYGEKDWLVAQEARHREATIIAGAGHDLSLEAPAALAERLAYWNFSQ